MRIVGSILVIGALAITGFYAMLFAAFSGHGQFYMPFVITVAVLVAIFSNLAIWGQGKKKWFKMSFVSFISLSLISVSIFEINQQRVESLKILTKQDVNLHEYTPNRPGTKTVILREESTFRIQENLPRLDGSTALYPVYAGFVQAVDPEREYDPYHSEVMSTQTSNAYERLLAGDVDMIFVPQPSKKYMELAKERGRELKMTPVGKEAFVFFVNADNKVNTLTVEQVQGIYSGNIRKWKEIGGTDDFIEAFQRPEESGSQQALIRFMGNKTIMKPTTERVAAGMGGMMDQVAEYQNKENAIGFSFRYFSEEMVHNGKIRNLAIDGVAPTKETIRNGSYPATMEFYVVTAGSENPHIEPFVNWILSKQGQTIIEETGYVSIQ
jgi:phosphate transport system substrate-binding protein